MTSSLTRVGLSGAGRLVLRAIGEGSTIRVGVGAASSGMKKADIHVGLVDGDRIGGGRRCSGASSHPAVHHARGQGLT